MAREINHEKHELHEKKAGFRRIAVILFVWFVCFVAYRICIALFSRVCFRFNSQHSIHESLCMRVLITTERIQERLTELAAEIGPQYRDRPLTIVGILIGSLM